MTSETHRRFWRNLQEAAQVEDFEMRAHQEFPRQALALGASLNRREFMKLMGAALALAGLEACTPLPSGKIVPALYLLPSLWNGKPAPANPWNAKGLEWETSSPPPTHNFEHTPVVDSGPYQYGPSRPQ